VIIQRKFQVGDGGARQIVITDQSLASRGRKREKIKVKSEKRERFMRVELVLIHEASKNRQVKIAHSHLRNLKNPSPGTKIAQQKSHPRARFQSQVQLQYDLSEIREEFDN
jgi:hypothetical protein